MGASLAMEKVPPRLRGLLSGMLQQGYALGYLAGGGCFFFVFPRWGWRPMFFIGGLPALLGRFRPLPRERIGGVGEDSPVELEQSGPRDFLPLETVSLSDRLDDDDELRLARHAGYVSNLPAAPVGNAPDPARGDHCHLHGGSDSRRPADWLVVRPLRTPPHDGRRTRLRNRTGPAVGLRSVSGLAGRRSFPDPVHGAGSVGHHSRAPLRIVARLGARIPSRIRLPVWRASGRLGRVTSRRFSPSIPATPTPWL